MCVIWTQPRTKGDCLAEGEAGCSHLSRCSAGAVLFEFSRQACPVSFPVTVLRRDPRDQFVQAVLATSRSKDEISPGDLDFHVRPFIEPDFLGDGLRDPNTQAVSPFCNPSAQSPPASRVLKTHNGNTPELARLGRAAAGARGAICCASIGFRRYKPRRFWGSRAECFNQSNHNRSRQANVKVLLSHGTYLA